jgi:hypothetical protein
MTIASILEVWIPIVLMIVAISFVFFDWFGWRWLEHWIIGTGAGVLVATNWRALNRSGITPLLAGNIILIIPIIMGLLLYFRFVDKYQWLARYGFLWVIAGGAGVTIGGMVQSQILPQVIESVKIIRPTAFETISAALVFFIFVTSLSYFLFTREHTGILGTSSRLGRLFLMVGFGLGFSTLIQTYFGVILERVQWMLFTILGK